MAYKKPYAARNHHLLKRFINGNGRTRRVFASHKKPVLEAGALYLITRGMYIISLKKDNERNGQILSSLLQVSSDPQRLLVSINKESLTYDYIRESKVFSVSILSIDTPRKFIMTFGFRSGRSFDKFKDVSYKIGISGAPIVLDNALAYLDCQVITSIDFETHTAFARKIVDAELLKTGTPMPYAHYCEVLRGKTPVTPPSHICVRCC